METRSSTTLVKTSQLMQRFSSLPRLEEDVYPEEFPLSDSDIERHLRATLAYDETSNGQINNVWDLINAPRGGSMAEAIETILVERVSAIESRGIEVLAIMQFAIRREVWHSHPDVHMRTADAWLGALESRRALKSAIILGALGANSKQKHLIAIAQAWQGDWYDKIDRSIRPLQKQPDLLSKKELELIARMATGGTSLEQGNAKFKTAVRERMQRQRKLKDHRHYLTRQDLESLLQSQPVSFKKKVGRRTKPITNIPSRYTTGKILEEVEDDPTEQGEKSDKPGAGRGMSGKASAEREKSDKAVAEREKEQRTGNSQGDDDTEQTNTGATQERRGVVTRSAEQATGRLRTQRGEQAIGRPKTRSAAQLADHQVAVRIADQEADQSRTLHDEQNTARDEEQETNRLPTLSAEQEADQLSATRQLTASLRGEPRQSVHTRLEPPSKRQQDSLMHERQIHESLQQISESLTAIRKLLGSAGVLSSPCECCRLLDLGQMPRCIQKMCDQAKDQQGPLDEQPSENEVESGVDSYEDPMDTEIDAVEAE